MALLPFAFTQELRDIILGNPDASKEWFAAEKKRFCAAHGIQRIPSDIEVLTSLPAEDLEFAKPLLLTKPVRSQSGVCVVAIMAKPSRCPHGRCTYCPGGLGSPWGDVPQSYTGHEPASLRAARAGYDAYLQVFNRLEQYVVSGHDPEKVELIVMGGTFPHEPWEYQLGFVREAFQALNDFSERFYRGDAFDVEGFREFFLLPGDVKDEARTAEVQRNVLGLKGLREASLEEEHLRNEEARCRCVGLTVETRPSHGRLRHGNDLLSLGCTRVELGVQTLFDDVLARVHRGHTVAETEASLRELRDLGFKLNCHLMLGMPGMTRERDLEAASKLFSDPAYLPDMVKLYPCMVMAGTHLEEEMRRGDFAPLTTAQAADLLADVISLVPRWCRVMRVQRDIPTKVTLAGVDRTNLRQLVDERMAVRGIVGKDIRAREIRGRPIRKAVLNVVQYVAAGGEEFFISIDDSSQDALIGFCRLRFPARQLREEFDVRTAIIRELHVYGKAAPLGTIGVSAQHRGFGSQLVSVAERIAREHGKRKLLIISGVGVRGYYRRLGYEREGPYMAKRL